MMRDLGRREKLDALLRDWHQWQEGYKAVPTCRADPSFRNAKSGKGWDTTSEVIEDELSSSTMETIDAQVDELPDEPKTRPYRSAIYALARNLHAGASVWSNPKLPLDSLDRAAVLMEARLMLSRRLVSAGVL